MLYWILISVVLACNGYATFLVLKEPDETARRVILQLLLVWCVPFLGAGLVILVLNLVTRTPQDAGQGYDEERFPPPGLPGGYG